MTGKTLVIIGAAAVVVAGGIYAATQIDWNAEGDKMAYELSDESALAKYNAIDWNKELDIMADDIKTKNYVGTWEQVATYINGEAQDHTKATLVLSKGAYESKTTCLVTGKLSVSGDNLTMTVGTDTCTGGAVSGPFTYIYQISKDNQILTLDYSQGGFGMREMFKRSK